MEYKARQAILQGYHGGEVAGWIRPGLTEEQEAAIRERLIQSRFEHVDEYLARIDEYLWELAELGALEADTVNAIYEARAAVMKLRPMKKDSPTG